MSIKYFTGNNLDAHSTKSRTGSLSYPTSRAGDTKPTYFWYPETVPVNNADGIDAKGQGIGSKWDRVKAKVHTTAARINPGGSGKSNAATKCRGKYELGKMWKYRKTLKKILSATGQAAATGTPKGERNMFSDKGNGHTGTKHSKAAATDHALYPIAQAK